MNDNQKKCPLEVRILTVRRSPDYLSQTLASLLLSRIDACPIPAIRLMLGSLDEEHLKNLKHHGDLLVDVMCESEWTKIQHWSVHRRLSYNFWRTLAVESAAEYGLCVCEDDIVFTDGFVSKLLQAVEEIRRQQAPKFILAAYSPYDNAREPARKRGTFYCSYNASCHYGNCCLFISKDGLRGLADYVKRHAVENDEAPVDIILGRYAEALWESKDGGMYQTICSLAQHVGYVSGGTSGQYFCSPSFGREWPSGNQQPTSLG